MDELLSEKEQVEQIRNWWKENGTYVIAGIVLGVGGIFGFNAWKGSQSELRVEASSLFEQLAEEVAENRLETAEAIATDLYADYGTTVYSDQARLAMARLYMDQGRDQDAAEALEGLVSSGNTEELVMVARLRLAKIYLYQGKPEAVLTLLSGFENTGFAARYSEAIGDAHFALGDPAAAETAWAAALDQDASNQTIDTALVQMKINDLPVDAAVAGDAAVSGEPPADDDASSESAAISEAPADDDVESEESVE